MGTTAPRPPVPALAGAAPGPAPPALPGPAPRPPPAAAKLRRPTSPLHTAAFQAGLISQAFASVAMLSLGPSLRRMYEFGTPPTEPSKSWMAAAFQATPFRLSLPHLRSIGGKYTGLALMNFAPSISFSVLT